MSDSEKKFTIEVVVLETYVNDVLLALSNLPFKVAVEVLPHFPNDSRMACEVYGIDEDAEKDAHRGFDTRPFNRSQ